MVRCIEQNTTIDFSLVNDDFQHIDDLPHTKQFLWAVFTTISIVVLLAIIVEKMIATLTELVNV